MAGIRVLREFPCDVTTGHVTEGNPPLQCEDWDIFNSFKEDGPNSALCKYHNIVPLGFRVPLVQNHEPAGCSSQQNGVLSCLVHSLGDFKMAASTAILSWF